MRKYIIICVSLILLSGCVKKEDNKKLLNQIYEKDDYIAKLEDVKLQLEDEILELKNNNEELKSIINSKGEIAHNQYFMETRNENVYLKIELEDIDSGDYTRQLWRYNNFEDPCLLYESKGLDFRVSPNEKFIAINYSNNNRSEITIINEEGEILLEPDFSELDSDSSPYLLYPYLYGWSNGSRYFWGTMQRTCEISYYFVIDTDNWKVTTIKNTNNIGCERSINTQNGWVCYSNYPFCFDIDSANEFKESKKEVKLYLYNVFKKEKIHLDSSITKKFYPKWIDENTLEYDDPLSDKRIKYTLK